MNIANLTGLLRALGLTAALGILGPPALAQAVRPPISQVRAERIV